MERLQTRREFLAAAAAGAVALSVPGRARAVGAAGAQGYATFVSAPGLKIPTLTVNTVAGPAPGYVFVTTLTGPGRRGPQLVDDAGQPVWFRQLDQVAIDFRRQTYQGRPVLTWWEGTISQIGTGRGVGVIVDQHYQQVAEVQAGNGYAADVHEFLLTPQGTALITIYNETQADLTAVGGPASGPVLDSILQEVDVKTGKVLLEWHSLEHVPLTDAYAPVLTPFDYFHINSIDVHPDGDLIVSARNTSAVYKLDRKSGQVLWALGGRSSSFDLGPRVFFMYQHDARAHADGTLTLYDDGPGPSSQQSRAIRIGLDLSAMRALLLQEYVHPTPLESSAMGNAQVLSDGGVMVGWGTEPYVTEFGPLGNVRFDARFDGGAWNYRAFRDTWVGLPTTKPSVAVRKRTGGLTVYASWNGSTETAYWRIDGGPARGALRPLRTVKRTGFETVVDVPGGSAYLAATALDASRRPLATSPARRVA